MAGGPYCSVCGVKLEWGTTIFNGFKTYHPRETVKECKAELKRQRRVFRREWRRW